MRFAIKKVENTADKVFVLIQAVLGGISLNAPEYKGPDCQLYLEAFSIFRHVNRLARAVVEIGIVRKDGKQIKHGLELVRCSAAKSWEDRPVVLRQIDNLGEKSIKILAENGVTTLDGLRSQNPLRIDALLQRKLGFGHDIVALASAMPRYRLEVEETGVYESKEKGVEVEIAITCGLINTGQEGGKPKDKKVSKKVFDMTSVLTISSDYELIDFRRTSNKALKTTKVFNVSAHLTKPSQSIIVIVSPEMDLEGLEDVPDFWQMGLSEGSDDKVKVELKLPKPVAAVEAPKSRKQDSGMVQPRKLPNGNYECNHPCNDKAKCRHYCCKHGLPAPPVQHRKPKGKEQKPTISDNPMKQPKERKTGSSVQRLHKKPLASGDKKLNDLQKYHDNASVSKSLGLPTGQRLKLEPAITVPTATSKKPKQQASYELSFTDLGESPMLSSGISLDDVELDCDDDEPPESVAEYLASEKERRLAPTHKPKLKRNASIISLGTDDEEYARPSVTKKSRKTPSSSVTWIEDQRDEAPLFIPTSPGDYTVNEAQAPSSPTLMDDIGKFLGFDDCDLTAAEVEEPPTDWKTTTVPEHREASLEIGNTNQTTTGPAEDAGNEVTNDFYDFLDDLGEWLDNQVEESGEVV
ncbi:hypothetical protein EST38_g3523 [Candolleomyces aberdarensis]|uniref:SEC63 domain-containing protein n=1 Tax=Candolleomyces aberdarensis TaxID=2316362 RepID=A0A4Q2DQL8_9AGAR|nr:hypothetical protein EST38_g3523 [Candolleomyces aberdarensis]